MSREVRCHRCNCQVLVRKTKLGNRWKPLVHRAPTWQSVGDDVTNADFSPLSYAVASVIASSKIPAASLTWAAEMIKGGSHRTTWPNAPQGRRSSPRSSH